jgi:hypothetical protein
MSIDATTLGHQPSTATKSGIVWVASYPRSGNTWIRMFLFNLSQIIEGDDAEQNLDKLSEFSPWDGETSRYAKYLPAQDQLRGFPQTRDAAWTRLKNLAAVRQSWQRDLCNGLTGPIFVKTHWIDKPVFGNAAIDYSVSLGGIYCVRNPLDVLVSLADFFDAPIDSIAQLMGQQDAFLGGNDAVDYLGTWSEHVISWSKQENLNVCVVRFEDLLENPELWFGVMARHVFNPPPTVEQIRRAIHRSSFDRLRTQEQQQGFVGMPSRSFFKRGRAGEWRRVLASHHVNQIVNDHGQQMARFGYDNKLQMK